ncbi:MAG: Hpt domain-containing protein, partial [Planctomycetota bacterium]|nr:Hpt domain-containing protein [Planctomycetota bacterium]
TPQFLHTIAPFLNATIQNPTAATTRLGTVGAVDLDDLHERCMGNPKVALLMLEKLVEQLPSSIGQMHMALNSNDNPALASAAHGLKGAAGAVGCEELHAAARELEMAAKGLTDQQKANLLEQIQQLADQLRAVLPECRTKLAIAPPAFSSQRSIG